MGFNKAFELCLLLLVTNELAISVSEKIVPKLSLNDGNELPAIGFDAIVEYDEETQTSLDDNNADTLVPLALDAGYRLINAAYDEEQLANALEKSTVPREELVLSAKLGSGKHRHVKDELKESLKKMKVDYVDLYLIAFPISFKEDDTYDDVDYVDTWKQMEEVKKEGLAKSIGVANFNISQMERLLDNCEIKPAVLQVEVNLNLAQEKLREFCKSHDIVMLGYSTFGSMFSKEDDTPAPPPRVDDPVLVAIADSHKKTTLQVALRYLIQLNVVPIVKSVTKERLTENIDVFDFELTPEEMEKLGEFNQNYRTVRPTFWQDHPFYPFEKEDKPQPE